MSSQWDLVGGDPAPGDPNWIVEQAQFLRTIGGDATQSREQLAAIGTNWSNSDWAGLAAEAFRSGLGSTVLPDLQKMSDSYGLASSALASFAAELSELQSAARTNLTRAQEAQSALGGANQQIGGAESVLATAAAQIRTLTTRLNTYQLELTFRRATPGVNPTSDPTIHNLEYDISITKQSLLAVEQTYSATQSALSSARNAAADAQSQLNAARATIDGLQSQFEQAVSRTLARLEEAERIGLHSLSFVGRLVKRAETDVVHWARDARGIGDEAWSTLVSAAPEIHAIAHALDRIVDDIAQAVDEAAPDLELAVIALSVIAVVAAAIVAPEAIPLILPAAAAAYRGIATAKGVADAAKTVADEEEAGSDVLMVEDGQGNLVNERQDVNKVANDFVEDGEDATFSKLQGSVDDPLGIPSTDDVMKSWSAGEFDPVQTITGVSNDQAWSPIQGQFDEKTQLTPKIDNFVDEKVGLSQ